MKVGKLPGCCPIYLGIHTVVLFLSAVSAKFGSAAGACAAPIHACSLGVGATSITKGSRCS